MVGEVDHYSLEDFDAQYFTQDWHTSHDKLGNGCKIDFPLYMYSKVKFSQATYTLTSTGVTKKPHDFTEVVYVDVVKVAGYLSSTHSEYHYKLQRGWGSRYYTIHGNGEDRVQNFRTKFLILCRELCLLTSTYLKINNLRRD